MEKKYELTEEAREVINDLGHTITLHRIKALRDFSDVVKGELGGWVESEYNLSHEGNCWIYDDAKVFGHAQIVENACLYGNASVCDHAVISENAALFDNVRVYGVAMVLGKSQLCGHASVSGVALVKGHATLSGNSVVFGHARVHGHAAICEHANIGDHSDIFGNATIDGHTFLKGHMKIYGNTIIKARVRINGDLSISDRNQIVVIGHIGSRTADTIFIKTDKAPYIYVCTGCFHGDIDEFKEAVMETHQKGSIYRKEYEISMKTAEEIFRARNLLE